MVVIKGLCYIDFFPFWGPFVSKVFFHEMQTQTNRFQMNICFILIKCVAQLLHLTNGNLWKPVIHS